MRTISLAKESKFLTVNQFQCEKSWYRQETLAALHTWNPNYNKISLNGSQMSPIVLEIIYAEFGFNSKALIFL